MIIRNQQRPYFHAIAGVSCSLTYVIGTHTAKADAHRRPRVSAMTNTLTQGNYTAADIGAN